MMHRLTQHRAECVLLDQCLRLTRGFVHSANQGDLVLELHVCHVPEEHLLIYKDPTGAKAVHLEQLLRLKVSLHADRALTGSMLLVAPSVPSALQNKFQTKQPIIHAHSAHQELALLLTKLHVSRALLGFTVQVQRKNVVGVSLADMHLQLGYQRALTVMLVRFLQMLTPPDVTDVRPCTPQQRLGQDRVCLSLRQ